MQSELARQLQLQHKIPNVGVDNFLLIINGQSYVFSDAALEIAKDLTGFCILFNSLKVVPQPIRSFCYKAFARNRYVLFGRTDACMMPSEEVKSRFVGVRDSTSR